MTTDPLDFLAVMNVGVAWIHDMEDAALYYCDDNLMVLNAQYSREELGRVASLLLGGDCPETS